jgi:hypothetical protein
VILSAQRPELDQFSRERWLKLEWHTDRPYLACSARGGAA